MSWDILKDLDLHSWISKFKQELEDSE